MKPRGWLIALVCGLSVCLAAPSPGNSHTALVADCGGVQTATAEHPGGALPPLAIGDSTMLLALPMLAREGFDVNARGCRQYPEALALLATLAREKRLPQLVAIALGANGQIEPAEIAAALRLLGPDRVLVLLTPRELGGGSGGDAQLVRAEARRHGTNLVALDWVAYSERHPSWFEPDGLHVNPTGAAAMSRLLATVLPLAEPAHRVSVPRCSPPAANPIVVGGNAEAQQTGDPGELLRDVAVHPHGPGLLLDPHGKHLQIPVVNTSAHQITGTAEVAVQGPRSPIVAAACFSIPQSARAQLQVPVSGELVADAELLARFQVQVTLTISSADGAGGRLHGSYVLRAGSH